MKSLFASVAALTTVAVAMGVSGCTVFGGPVLTPADLSGETVNQSRDHQDFTGIDFGGFGNVTFNQGSVFSVSVTTDGALQSHITSTVVDGVLRIDQDFTFVGPSPELTIAVTAPQVNSISLTGAGTITAAGLDTDTLDVSVSGVGDVYIIGRAKYTSVSVSGAGNARLESLRTGELTINVTGAGNAVVSASRTLEARISGAGDITATGKATDVSVRISGAGDFKGHDLEAVNATVDIAGVGSVHIGVNETLDVSISGLGDVTYYGDPHVTSSLSGLGNVKKG